MEKQHPDIPSYVAFCIAVFHHKQVQEGCNSAIYDCDVGALTPEKRNPYDSALSSVFFNPHSSQPSVI